MGLIRFSGLIFIGWLTVLNVQAANSQDSGDLPSNRQDAVPVHTTLAAFVRAALEDNPRLQAALSAVDAAEAGTHGAAKPLYNPELEFEAESAESETTTLGIVQTIDWADKRGARHNIAGFDTEAARAQSEVTRQQLTAELLAALGRYHSADALRQLAQQRENLMQRFLNQAERRRKAGDLSQVELDLARLAHAQALMQQAQASASRSDAEQALLAVVGALPRRAWPALPKHLPPVESFDDQQLLDVLPELRAQRARVAAAESTVILRQREQRPDPSLGLRGGREESDDLVGLTLTIPLFVRNNFSSETEAASAQLNEAQQIGQDAYRRAQARLRSAAARYRVTYGAWSVWEQSGQPSLSNQLALLERLWQAGEISIADYLLQLKQSLETRASALELRGQLWRSWIEWLAASGQFEAWLSGSYRNSGEHSE